MSSVDDRIVNMQFNNQQFTKGAADSQAALQNLEGQLVKTGQSKGISTLGASVDGVKTKFTALQVAGAAALGTIVSKATSTGLSLVKSLTLDPILQGFQEYTTNLNSIQTVVANTGESVDVVNGYMQKLNAYSDQTIYNFSEMAKNIGTFTAAGVDLETATASIQGIANLAALSGSSSQQASTAMYQLSQAIAAGRVGLQDWNSVVNAGMGGKVFQTALANTAVAMGDISAASIGLEGPMKRLTVNGQSFRQSISAAAGASSWLSSDVLVNTLAAMDGRFSSIALGLNGYSKAASDAKIQQARLNLEQKNGVKFTDEQFKALLKTADAAYEAATTVKSLPQLLQVVRESIGSIFANSFQIILGDFEQSKKLWNAVGKAIVGPSGFLTKMGTAWTGLLRSFVETGGRTKVLSGLGRIFRNLGKVMNAVKEAYQDIFPPSSGNALKNIAKGFNRFTRFLVLHKDTVENLKTVFAGFFSILHIGFEIIKGVFLLVGNVFKAVLSSSDGASGGILSLVASIAKLITGFDKWLTAGGRVSETMANIGTVIGTFISPVLKGLGLIISGFAALVSGQGIGGVIDKFDELSISSEAVTKIISDGWAMVTSFFTDDAISTSTGKMTSGFDRLKAAVSGFLGSGDGLSSFFKNLGGNAGALAGEGVSIAADIIAGIASGIAQAAPVLLAAMGDVARGVIEGFKSAMGINSPATEMIDPGTDVIRGIVEGIITGMSLLGKAIAAVGGFLRDAFTQLFGDMDALDFAALINSIISGGFLLALTNILNTIGSGGFLAGFQNVFDQLSNSLQAFQQNLKAQALLAIGTAVALLVASLVLLALLDPKQIGQGLGTIAIMMALLVGAMAALSKTTKGGVTLVFISGAMNEMATAILILSGAIAVLGNLDKDTLSQGMAALAISLALMVGALRALSGISGSLVAAGASMILIATSMSILAGAILLFANLDPDELGQGMSAMAIGLALMVGAIRALGGLGPSIALAGAAMLITAVAMQALAVAVLMFGKMDPDTLNQGMAAMAIGVALLTVALGGLGLIGPEVLAAAAAIAIVSASMVVLATAVGLFGNMDMGTLAQGFGAIAVGLGLVLLAALGAQYVAPGLAILSTVFLSLGIAMALAGAGMFLFATGFALLTATGIAGIAVITVAIEAFIALLPSIAIQVAASFVSFIETIAKAAPRIGEAFSKIFDAMLDIVIRAIPKIGELLQALITTGIGILRNSIPQWIDLGMTIIESFLKGLAKRIPEIADAALTMIEEFLKVIDTHLGNILDRGVDIIVTLIKGLGNAAERITKAAGEAILDLLNAIDDAVVKYSDEFRNAGLRIAGHLLDGLTGGLGSKALDAATAGLHHLGIGSKRAGGNPFAQAQAAVAAALLQANQVATGQNTGDAVNQAQNAAANQAKADRAAADAVLAQREADALAKKAEKKGAGKGIKAKAKAAQKKADNAAAKAQRLQDAADKAEEAAQRAADLKEADLHGKGDILSDLASEQALEAQKLFKKAEAERAKAAKLEGKDKKKMLAQAEATARAAAAMAAKASASATAAQNFYTQEVQARIASLEAEAAAEEKAKKDQAEFDAADNAGKAEILKKRALEDQAAADAAKALAAQKIAEAKALASTDPAAAMAALDAAEEAAALAKELADKAAQEREQAEQLLNQPGTSAGGGATGGGIQPSKSVLEDAARAVDRYTQSLQQAQEAAGANQQVVQYNQNVYSPAALSPAEVYRQTKNLVSASVFAKNTSPATTN